MRKLMIFAAASAIAATLGIGTVVSEELTTLRGPSPNADVAVSDVAKQEVGNRFERAYRQQPPLIPHNIDGYEVTFTNNKCMECHDWPGNSRFNAPKISETHYVDRAGVRLDKVAGTRYFCNQCHVPQIDAKPLVGNAFQNAIQVK